MNTTQIGVMVGSTEVELTAHWVQGDDPNDFAVAAITWEAELYSKQTNALVNEFIDNYFDNLATLLQEATNTKNQA